MPVLLYVHNAVLLSLCLASCSFVTLGKSLFNMFKCIKWLSLPVSILYMFFFSFYLIILPFLFATDFCFYNT